jgi:hypothetical protein
MRYLSTENEMSRSGNRSNSTLFNIHSAPDNMVVLLPLQGLAYTIYTNTLQLAALFLHTSSPLSFSGDVFNGQYIVQLATASNGIKSYVPKDS